MIRNAAARKLRGIQPSDGFLQFLGGAEGDLLGRLDLNRLAGRRITSHTRGALADLKNAQAGKPDAIACTSSLKSPRSR